MNVTILMREHLTNPVLADLRNAGVKIARVLPHIQVVTGTIDPAQLPALRAMPEVKSAEEEGVVSIRQMEKA